MKKISCNFLMLMPLFLFFSIGSVQAAEPGPATITNDYKYTEEESVECKWVFEANLYKCAVGADFCVSGSPVAGYVNCDSCGGALYEYSYDLKKSSCKNKYWCTNLPWYHPGWTTEIVDKLGWTCHYVSNVNSWSNCSYDTGTQAATDVDWSSYDSKEPIADCSNQVDLNRNCGVCEPTSANLAYANTTEINNAPILNNCKWGTITNLKYADVYNEWWNWQCIRGGVPSGTCKAKMRYMDIGLRIKDDSLPAPGVIKVAVEAQSDSCQSPYRIYKNGHVWCIGLLPGDQTGHTRATKARIYAGGGVKIITELP